MNEIPADFAFKDNVTLESIEEGMRAVEDNIKFGLAILAVSLGRIKRDVLYYSVAGSFKEYIFLERTNLSYRKALHLAAIGENFWKFRPQLKENGLRLSEHMSKVRLLDETVIDNDPMFWERFQSLSVRELKGYIDRRKITGLNVYPAKEMSETVYAKGASLSIGGRKVKGLNLNEIRRETSKGRRAVIFWVEDDKEARKIKRAIMEKI
ncbi:MULTISPECIES: hypothetical protein [unclassified Oceanispirochaeta]|uniref:hypothetical protein n=1 Tax=unclassified Oceanispirochaeta TaxID=2635722 RepID=UPI000E08E6EA|nr:MULTISPECIES: hypothetical protein [unclassified Oceanispirochaeta]MBF9018842.1 hypothetical protein [Oceanispirochaeta sp. M2]NPD75330.1 hypothetical protein [Oceanispirochaeta sp. M1]RDG28822.1 hypothetical protein DV872_24865 [Oceanispirochaeta sp. M1]